MAHTAGLDSAVLDAAHALLVEAFDGGLDDADGEHSLGGMHALVWEGADLFGHAALVQRRVLHSERALRTGYVEIQDVRADRRGRGHGAAMMDTPQARRPPPTDPPTSARPTAVAGADLRAHAGGRRLRVRAAGGRATRPRR